MAFVASPQVAISRRRGDIRAAEQREDVHRLRLALHRDEIELDAGEIGDLLIGLLADDDGHAIVLRLRFEPRGEIHGVAENGIVLAELRAVADDAGARMMPTPWRGRACS